MKPCKERVISKEFDPLKAHLNQIELGKYEAQYGRVGYRKPPREEDDDGDGGGPESHPLIGQSAEFSGDFIPESVRASDNPDAIQEYQEELTYQNQAKLSKEYGATSVPTATVKPK